MKYGIFLLFAVGILFYILGLFKYGVLANYPNFCEILKKTGEILAISGVTSSVLRIIQYNRIYQKALEDVIYSKTFLSKRSDLIDIWKNVSANLFESRFPEIHTPLLMLIIDKYFPINNNVSYYTDVKQYLCVRWKDENCEDNIVEIEEKIDLVVHTVNTDKTTYGTRHAVIFDEDLEEDKLKEIIDVVSYSVDDRSCVGESNIFSWKKENGVVEFCSSAELPGGKNEYHIVQEVRRIQNLNIDDFLNYSARFLIWNMDVEIEHPANLKVELFGSGTVKPFVPMYEKVNHKRWTYKGLILRKQGYTMTFNKV